VVAAIVPLLVGALALFRWADGGGDEVGDLLPNLTQAAPGDLAGRTGGTPGAPRFFLGFESAAGNLGTGPLIVQGRRSTGEEPRMRLQQQIRRSDGSTRFVPIRATLRFVRSSDHSHWHLDGFMRYELRSKDGARVLRDRKTGFCLGDRYRVAASLPGRASTRRFSDRCGKGEPGLLTIREGISIGWGDNYRPHLEGQEFELTGLAGGRYVLVHRVNPRRQLQESDYSDNTASMAIDLSWPRGRKLPPRIDVAARCPRTATCP
jgi:hypothetical protein